MIHVFTCAAINYLAKVRLLCNSIRYYHPEFTIHLALADRLPDWFDLDAEPFDSVIEVESLDIPNQRGWIFGHSLVELSTAIKPFALNRLLAEPNCELVLYFDPDMVLFSRLDDLVDAANASNVVLTPHQTKPESTLEAIVDNEICSLNYGIFNLGFIGVRPTSEGRRFADWWSARLYHFCREALDQGLWTDQKWINFVPVFFDGVEILKSSRFNVAPWNVTTRKVAGDRLTGITVDEEPLGFYHFTGFESGAHKVMATKYAPKNEAVRGLIDWYERESKTAHARQASSTPWAYSTFCDGERISDAHRSIYRTRKDLQDAYPDPFDNLNAVPSYHDWFRWRALIEYPEIGEPDADMDLAPVARPYLRNLGSPKYWWAVWQQIWRRKSITP